MSTEVRKSTCFVCGVKFDTLKDMNDHIVEYHDEGREYIKCPDCGYCVRDMIVHYKVKHPKRIMPKNCQTKVSVWNDFSSDGKKKTRKPSFRTGHHISTKTGAAVRYRSGYECEVYELLDQDKEVIGYDAEPFKVPYVFQGEWHDYIPDIRVNFVDGKVEIWEIKPSSQTDIEKNKAKWMAMKFYAEKMGWDFTVITESGIGKLRCKIRQQKILNES